jgi:NADP-dependent 3-hydroxy acid dehydrogenase YdfG
MKTVIITGADSGLGFKTAKNCRNFINICQNFQNI